MGGLVTLRIATLEPDTFSNFVVMSSPLRRLGPVGLEYRTNPQSNLVGLRSNFNLSKDEGVKGACRYIEGVQLMIQATLGMPNDETSALQTYSLFDFYGNNAIEENIPEAPVLVIHGEDDVLGLIDNAEYLYDAAPYAEFITLPDGGHSATHQALIATANAIKDFVERNAAQEVSSGNFFKSYHWSIVSCFFFVFV